MDPLDSAAGFDPSIFNNVTITGAIAFVCVTVLAVSFKKTIVALVSKIFGLDRRKNGNKENGGEKDEFKRKDDSITRLQMENIILIRDKEIDSNINRVKEDLTAKMTASKEELTKLIMDEASKIYDKMEANKDELLRAINQIGGKNA